MKNKYLKIRIDDSRLSKLKQMAEYDEMSVSEWVRKLIDDSYVACVEGNCFVPTESYVPTRDVPTKTECTHKNVPTRDVPTRDVPTRDVGTNNVPTDYTEDVPTKPKLNIINDKVERLKKEKASAARKPTYEEFCKGEGVHVEPHLRKTIYKAKYEMLEGIKHAREVCQNN